jgi:hypothetical protein
VSPTPDGDLWTADAVWFPYNYTQYISRAPVPGETRRETARAWMAMMYAAIREVDADHLVTVGLLPNPDHTAFDPEDVAAELDFVTIHAYPNHEDIDGALALTERFAAPGKPLVVEEIAPLLCTLPELEQYVLDSMPIVDGFISFYWGEPADPQIVPWLAMWERIRPFILGEDSSPRPLQGYWSHVGTDHFYARGEPQDISALGYQWELEVGGILPFNPGDAAPLCRYWNDVNRDHFYTTSCDHAGARAYGYDFERVEGFVYVDPAPDRLPLYRYFNGPTGDHYYVTARNDIGLSYLGYQYEVLEGYVLAP